MSKMYVNLLQFVEIVVKLLQGNKILETLPVTALLELLTALLEYLDYLCPLG